MLNLQHTFYSSLEWNLTKPPDELLERLDELSVNLTPCCCKAATVLFGSLVPSVFSPVFSRPQRARRIFNRSQYCCVSPSPALPVLTPVLLLMEPALLLHVTTNKSKTLERYEHYTAVRCWKTTGLNCFRESRRRISWSSFIVFIDSYISYPSITSKIN